MSEIRIGKWLGGVRRLIVNKVTVMVCLWVGTFLGLGASTVYAQARQAKLTASDAAGHANFGRSVSVSGDIAIIGAWADSSGAYESGSAYAFKRSGSTWLQEAKLTASDAKGLDFFGWTVSVSGETAVIGDCRGYNSNKGSVYIFARSSGGWIQQAQLNIPDTGYGCPVSISGDSAVVGVCDNSGSAYVFARNGSVWTQQAKLTTSDVPPNNNYIHFGDCVSISGDTLIVGAWGNGGLPGQSGSAYIFKRSGSVWTKQAKLTSNTGVTFGCSVSISGDTAVIGDWKGNNGNKGSVYVFTRSGDVWTLQANLDMPVSMGSVGGYFSSSVSISNNRLIVGDCVGAFNTGSVYTFNRSGSVWTQQATLKGSLSSTKDSFGCSVAVSNNIAIIGAMYDGFGGQDSGAAHIFDLSILPHSTCSDPAWALLE